MTALVLGATGFVGRALVGALCEAGEDVRAGSRRAPEALPAGAHWVEADLARPETIERALAGVHTAYYLVHSMGRTGDFRANDRTFARGFARAAAERGCEQIVYLGGVAPRGQPSEHLASRLEVGEILRAGEVSALELRASMIVGAGSISWRIVRDLAARLPVMVLPRWLESRSAPISISDVIAALLDARLLAPMRGWFDIPGPDTLSVREMLETVAALDGRRLPALRVPVLTPRLSAMWLRLISGADYAVARELVMGLTEDLLPQHSLWDVTRRPARQPFRDAARAALDGDVHVSPVARAVERVVHRFGPHGGERTA